MPGVLDLFSCELRMNPYHCSWLSMHLGCKWTFIDSFDANCLICNLQLLQRCFRVWRSQNLVSYRKLTGSILAEKNKTITSISTAEITAQTRMALINFFFNLIKYFFIVIFGVSVSISPSQQYLRIQTRCRFTGEGVLEVPNLLGPLRFKAHDNQMNYRGAAQNWMEAVTR